MDSFKGITQEYRRTEEYQSWYAAIKADFPQLPQYLVDMAIACHKTDPQAYKKVKGADRNAPAPSRAPAAQEQVVVDGAVQVLEADDPSLTARPSVKVVEK